MVKAVREGESLVHHVTRLLITCRERGQGMGSVFALFLILSLISLWLPEKLNPVLFVILLLVVVDRMSSRNKRETPVSAFQYLLLLYALWIAISGSMHYVALSRLEPTSYITISQRTADWGLYTVKRITQIYLLFPLLLLAAIYIFQSRLDIGKKLYLFPIILIPSLIVALYQGLVDIEFLNGPYFSELHQVSGLSQWATSLGFILFFGFPFCLLSLLLVRNWWKRLCFAVIGLVMLWCLQLSGSRTGFLGIILFVCFFPWIWAWAETSLSKATRRVLILAPLICIVIVCILGIFLFETDLIAYSSLTERLHDSYWDFRKGGIARILERSSRSHLWRQGYRLTKESPLSGLGPGGFYRNLDNVRCRYGEDEEIDFMDNVNNHYLQMSSEIGLLGLFFDLLIHVFPLWMLFRIHKRIRNREERWTVGIVFTTLCIGMLLFGTLSATLALDVAWVLTVLLAFLFVVSLRHGYSINKTCFRPLSIVLVFLTLLFTIGTYDNAFGSRGYRAAQLADWWLLEYDDCRPGRNCYEAEEWRDGGIIRWCSRNARLRIPITGELPETIELKFYAHHPDIGQKPVVLRYGGKDGPAHTIELKEKGEKSIQIPLTQSYVCKTVLANGTTRQFFILCLDVSRTWVPEEWGMGDDPRNLGVALLMPAL